jgi:hypothetical protein
MTSATNERQVKLREEQQRRDRLTDEIITKQLMSTPDGRRWVWLRLSEARLFNEDEDLDPGRMALAKGRRNAGLRLLADVTTFTPSLYITMTEEATSVQLKGTPDVRSSDDSDDD